MSVVKMIELVGTSEESWENAVQAALDDANKTIKNIESIDVTNLSAVVQDGKIIEWNAETRIAFKIEDRLRSEHHEQHEHGEKVSM
ncbi:MAG: dodecin family protein [Armatimonadota bacterium]